MRPFSLPSTILLASSLTAMPLAAQTHAGESTPPAALLGFGAAAYVAGDEIFVGRPGEIAAFPMPAAEQGAVHVFRSTGDGWSEHAVVTTPDVAVGDGFGAALAVEGDRMVVGAPNEDAGRGAAYLFERDGLDGEWRQVARLQPIRPAPGEGFGQAVAFAGGVPLIGAPGRDGQGAVFAYERDASGAWRRTAELSPAGGDVGGRFGASLSARGDRLLVGAPGPFTLPLFTAPPPFQPGAAYVFQRGSDGAWEQEARLALSGTSAVGYAVLLGDDEALVSSPMVRQGGGAVFRFVPDGAGAWRQDGEAAPANTMQGALFGYSLAWAGEELLVGAPGANGLQGAVIAFRRGADGWTESQSLTARVQGMMGFFGGAVTASDRIALVGAPGADFFEGVGFLFTRAGGGEWSEAGRVVDDVGGLAPIVGGKRECGEEGAIEGFGCSEVDLVSFLPVQSLGGSRGMMVNDLWGWTDPETRREYALVGRFNGTAFVDVTDPENPVYLGNLPLTEGAQPNMWRDMKVYANHAFIVSDGAGPHGIQVFDLTRLRDVTSPPAEFDEDAHYDGIWSAHNIAINEETGVAYAVGNSMGGETCGGALHMVDIREPKNPSFAGCYADPATGNARTGYTHDTQCVIYRGPDADHQGKEICFNSSETALGIGDVTDKENPAPISSASYPNVGYAHQGWLSDDHRYFFLNDELDELSGSVVGTRTLVWDIEDLDDPVLAKEFIGTTEASDHNLYVRGRYMYQSNYVSGLRIIDVADPENPVEVGYFDTVPWGADGPGFAGSWSNYPYFESGNILVSSMREGLFILRKQEPELVP